MKVDLKPIDEQVMVITGGSSGIGLEPPSRPHGRARRSCSIPATRWTSRGRWRGSTPRGAGDLPCGRCGGSRGHAGAGRASGLGVRQDRHLGEQRGRFLMAGSRKCRWRTPAGSSRPTTGAWSTAPSRRCRISGSRAGRYQRREHPVEHRLSASGPLHGEQARGEGLHRLPPARAGRGSRAGRGDFDPARGHRHAVPPAREELSRRRAAAPAAGIRAGSGGGSDHSLRPARRAGRARGRRGQGLLDDGEVRPGCSTL